MCVCVCVCVCVHVCECACVLEQSLVMLQSVACVDVGALFPLVLTCVLALACPVLLQQVRRQQYLTFVAVVIG